MMTIKGEIDESKLHHVSTVEETDTTRIEYHEWYYESELVKNDVNMVMKHGLFCSAVASIKE